MRFFGLATTALAAVAFAAPQESYDQSTTTSVAKQTITRTVVRVVETVTATRNGTLSAYESTTSETILATGYPSATGHLPSYGNGTSSVLGASALPSHSTSMTGSGSTPVSTGTAGKFGVEAISVAAIAGLVGLAIF